MTDLNTLADRVEAAEPGMESKLLEEAWEALAEASVEFRRFAVGHHPSFGTNAAKFAMLLDAHAFTDAAMMLAKSDWWFQCSLPLSPEAYGYSRESDRKPRANFQMMSEPYSGGASAATLPLAICAAALRARREQGDG